MGWGGVEWRGMGWCWMVWNGWDGIALLDETAWHSVAWQEMAYGTFCFVLLKMLWPGSYWCPAGGDPRLPIYFFCGSSLYLSLCACR